MTKPQVIRWLKNRQEEVLEEQKKKHEKALRDFKHNFVQSRVTQMELEFFQTEAKNLVSSHRSLMQQLTTNGPDRGWLSFIGDAVKIADCPDLTHFIVERLDFKKYPPYNHLSNRQSDERSDTKRQWTQLVAHCKTLYLKDVLTFLEGMDLTPPPEPKAAPAPQLPMIAFDRKVLLGVS